MIEIPFPPPPEFAAEARRIREDRREARAWLSKHAGHIWLCTKCHPRGVERLHPPELVRVWRLDNRFTDTCDCCREWAETEPYLLRSILEALP